MDLQDLLCKIRATSDEWSADIKKIAREGKELEKAIKPIQDQAKNVGKAFSVAGGAVTAAVVGMVKVTADYGAEVNKMRIQTGISASELTKLRFAAEQSETSFEGVAAGLKFLSRNAAEAAEGSKAQAAAFKDIGISVTTASGALRPMNDLLLDVADRFQGMEDGTAKAALAQKLFGKSGMDLIPILNEGREGIQRMGTEAERLGLVMSDDAAAAADQFDDSMTALKASAQGLAVTIGSQLIPGLTSLADGARNGVASITSFAREHESLNIAIAGTGAVLTGTGGLLLALGTLGTVAPKIAMGFQTMATGAKLARAELVTLQATSTLITAPGAIKSYGDLQAAVSLVGQSSKLAQAGMLGLAAAAGVAIGELINMGLEATGLREEIDNLLISSDLYGKLIGTTAQAQELQLRTTQAAADVLKNQYGVTIEENNLSVAEWNTRVDEALRAHVALNPELQNNISLIRQQSEAAQSSALPEFWKKAAAAHEAFIQKQREFIASTEAALKPADELEKKINQLTIRFDEDELVRAFSDELIRSVDAQNRLGYAVSETMQRLADEARQMRDATEATKAMADEQRRVSDEFTRQLRPADELQKKLDLLNKQFSKTDILKIYRDEIIRVADDQLKLTGKISGTMQAWLDMANASKMATETIRNFSDPMGAQWRQPTGDAPSGGPGPRTEDLAARALAGIGGLAPQPAIPANFNIGGLSPAISGRTLSDLQNVFRDWFPGQFPINQANTRPDLGLGMTPAQMAAMNAGATVTPSVARFGMGGSSVNMPVQLNSTNNISISTLQGMSEQDVANAVVRQLETNNRGFLEKTASMLKQAEKGVVSRATSFASG